MEKPVNQETAGFSGKDRDIALSLRGLRKQIGPVRIFTGIDIDLYKGEILAVLGPWKSGKTHLMRAAAGLMPVDRGVVDSRGLRPGFMPAPPGAGPGGPSLEMGMFPRTSIRDQLEFLAACARIPRIRRDRVVDDVLALMDLSDFADKTALQLDRRQKARVFFAGALIRDPVVLLLDDPLPAFAQDLDVFWAVCRELAGMGKSVMLSTRNPDLLASGPDRVAVLYGGAVAFHGEREAVLERLRAAGWPPPQAFFGGIAVPRPPVRRRAPPVAKDPSPAAEGLKYDTHQADASATDPALRRDSHSAEAGEDALSAQPPQPAQNAAAEPEAVDAPGVQAKGPAKGTEAGAFGAFGPRVKSSPSFSLSLAVSDFLSQARRLPGPLFWNDLRMIVAKGRAYPWIAGSFAALCLLILSSSMPGSTGNATFSDFPPGRALFLAFSVILMFASAFVGPFFSATGFVRDRNRRTFDLLVSSGLTPMELVGGRFLSALVATLAVCLAGAPSLFAALSLGGVPWAEAPKHAVLFVTTAAAVCSIGVALSLLLRSAGLAVFMSCLLAVFLFVISVVAAAIVNLIAKNVPGIVYPGFYVVASALNAVTTLAMLGGASLAFRALSRWDY